MKPGDRITLGHGLGERQATVVAVGGCGWDRCPYGDDCVTVLEDGAFTTTNYQVDKVRAG